MIRRTITLLLLGILVLQSACIKEDLSECIFRLVFNFEPPDRPAGAEPFEVDVSNLSVFAFDDKGIFLKEIEVSNPVQGEIVKVPAPAGTYTLVIWAGFTKEQLTDANLQKGISRIEDFYMPAYRLTSIGKSVPPEAFYYGIVHRVDIDLPPMVLSQEVQLVQSSKPFRLRISGLNQSNYHLVISNNAGRYSYENIVVPSGTSDNNTVELMTKLSVPAGAVTIANEENTSFSVRTGILWPVGLGDRKIEIVDVGTGEVMLSMSLINLLEKLQNVDFDQESALNLLINYRSKAEIDVNLNGWWIINSNNEI